MAKAADAIVTSPPVRLHVGLGCLPNIKHCIGARQHPGTRIVNRPAFDEAGHGTRRGALDHVISPPP